MKYLLSLTIITAILITGCKEKEDSASEVAGKAIAEAPVVESAAVSDQKAKTADSLVAGTKDLDEAVAEVVDEVTPVAEASLAEMKEASLHAALVKMPEKIESVELAGKLAEKPQAKSNDLMTSASSMGNALASQINWTSLSWDKVSEIPYQDKEQLLTWALAQTQTWKSQLTEAAKKKGLNALSGLGDTGWEGTFNTVLKSIDTVRESSPETWEMARSAMIGAWEKFEAEASKYISGS